MGNIFGIPIRQLRALVYDTLVLELTTKWYNAVLSRLECGSIVLDVGIGTAGALIRCKDILLEREIRIVGIDYDACYVRKAREAVVRASLGNSVSVVCMNVYDVQKLRDQLIVPGESDQNLPCACFDAVYFSGSISLLPDIPASLEAVKPLLKTHKATKRSAGTSRSNLTPAQQQGEIYITQTYQRFTPPLLYYAKPLLKYLMTIDFGQLITEKAAVEVFQNQLPAQCELECVEHNVIKGSVNNFMQAAYLTILRRRYRDELNEPN